MEIEIQSEQVIKHIPGYFSNGLLRDTGEDCITQFLEERGSDAGCAVYQA